MSLQQLICNKFGQVRQKIQVPIVAISTFIKCILLIYYHYNNKTEKIQVAREKQNQREMCKLSFFCSWCGN